MYVNGQQIPSSGLNVSTVNEKTTTLAYQNLFCFSGIHHGNSGIQMAYAMFSKGYFMILFYITPDSAVSEVHRNICDSGSSRMDVKSDATLTAVITCLFYLQYDANILIDAL